MSAQSRHGLLLDQRKRFIDRLTDRRGHAGLAWSWAVQVGDESEAGTTRARVNILDVAERAGVSPATVSRSLRGLAKVAPETRQRVLDAARELSYVASLQASGLAAGSRPSVAVIVPFITRWFFSTVTAGAVDFLRIHGYDAMLYHLGSADIRDHFFERMPLAPRVDGILTLSMPLTEEHTLALRAPRSPHGECRHDVPGSPSVGIDDAAAARGAVNHLLHQSTSGSGSSPARPTTRLRLRLLDGRRRGYEQALQAAGLAVDEHLVAAGPHGLQGGAAAMAQLLSGPIMPTAVFAEYDELAIGALWALRRASVPARAMSVVGVDDHEMAAMLDLTTVAQDAREQGAVAARLLLRALDDHPVGATDDDVVLSSSLVLRGTTAPPRTH